MNNTEKKVAVALLMSGKIYGIAEKDFRRKVFIKDEKLTKFILKNINNVSWEKSAIWGDGVESTETTFDSSSSFIEAIGGYVFVGEKKYYIGGEISAIDAALSVAKYYNIGE